MSVENHRQCGRKWPGMDAERDNVKYPENPQERFNQLASMLEDALRDLTGQKMGSLNDLTTRGNISAVTSQMRGVARWEGGRSFADTVQRGHDELTDIYEQVNQQFGIAIDLVRAGGGGYQAVDDRTFNA